MWTRRKKSHSRRHRDFADVPWALPPSGGPVRFDPSLRRAADLVAGSAEVP